MKIKLIPAESRRRKEKLNKYPWSIMVVSEMAIHLKHGGRTARFAIITKGFTERTTKPFNYTYMEELINEAAIN